MKRTTKNEGTSSPFLYFEVCDIMKKWISFDRVEVHLFSLVYNKCAVSDNVIRDGSEVIYLLNAKDRLNDNVAFLMSS